MIITNLIVTSFCACKLCCGPHASGLCANGKPPIEGITIAASRQYKLGTHVRISGFTNDFIIQDRLARKYDNRVDIYMARHHDALLFGKQNLEVTIYENR